MVTKGERRGGGTNWEVRINTYKQLYIRQVSNKDLLCGIGNYTQYLVITYMEYGKKKKKKTHTRKNPQK